MEICSIRIRNFRRLQEASFTLSAKTTLFVGANNSGKTSAMEAMRKFLIKGEQTKFSLNDITVIHRKKINAIGEMWVSEENSVLADLSAWEKIVPSIDIWLSVEKNEFHLVAPIIPTLDWEGGNLGVRLCYFPKDQSMLFEDYRTQYSQARNLEKLKKERAESRKRNSEDVEFSMPPKDLCDFLDRDLAKYFEIKTYLLDPQHSVDNQDTDFSTLLDDAFSFSNLIQVDMIPAQRPLSNPDKADSFSLSRQLLAYFNQHLNTDNQVPDEDLETLESLIRAQVNYDSVLNARFKGPLTSLQEFFGFPGIADPEISIESNLDERTAFEHNASLHYRIHNGSESLQLPERFNGLGYQNLISIAFRLMSFRDSRLRTGVTKGDDKIVPLHLVLVEEPEAHLHPQVQQVIINKAYNLLTNEQTKASWLRTQLVISTHSGHISNEMSFNDIRYFRRKTRNHDQISLSEVINLSDAFGTDTITERFVQRYMQLKHSDLFFADGVIFVEGTAESILVPYFIKQNNYETLSSRYITVIPVGGRYSDKFRPLIEKLGISTLIITDIDPVLNGVKAQSLERGKGLETSNSSLSGWGLEATSFDELLDLDDSKKVFRDMIRIAYQTPIAVSFPSEQDPPQEFLSGTFEDALIYRNLHTLPNNAVKVGLMKKIKKELEEMGTKQALNDAIYTLIKDNSGDKVNFVLDLIYHIDTAKKSEQISPPDYIEQGLVWLQSQLSPECYPEEGSITQSD